MRTGPDPLRLCGREIDAGYRVGKVLGAGGMGVVYEATPLSGGRPCALKVMTPAYLGLGAEPVWRFRREAQLGQRLRHEGLVAVLDHGELPDGVPYCAMELLSGRSLAELLDRSGPLPWEEAVELMAQAASALHSLHEAGVTHRDIKPENLQLLDEGLLKVLDLGVARAEGGFTAGANDVTDAGTDTGAPVGTPAYMAPEQMRDSKKVDGRADIYALGLVLFELMTGHQPFHGLPYADVVVLKHAPDAVPPLRGLCPEAPAALEALLQRCLAPVGERPLDMAALGAALLAVMPTTRARVRLRLSRRARRVPDTPLPLWGLPTLPDPRRALSRVPQRASRLAGAGRTPILGAAASPRRRLLLLVPVVALIGGGILWGALRLRGDAGPRAHATAALPVEAAPARPEPVTGAAVSPHPAPAATTALAATASRAARPARAELHRREPQAQGSGTGRLHIGVQPFAEIYIDGVRRPEGSPHTYVLPAGRHRVRAINTPLGRDESRAVRILQDRTLELMIDLDRPGDRSAP